MRQSHSHTRTHNENLGERQKQTCSRLGFEVVAYEVPNWTDCSKARPICIRHAMEKTSQTALMLIRQLTSFIAAQG
jgi:hypothetical protein